jgi:NitT/TauT family transport system substrate-binding protein
MRKLIALAARDQGIPVKVLANGNSSDLTKRFTEAINESLTYAQAHPDEVRQILGTYTQVATDVREKMTLPGWSAQLNRPAIETLAGLALEDGLIKKQADLGALLP